MVLVDRLLVMDLISAQRARLGLGSVDGGCWPMLDDCGYNGKRGELYRRRGYRLGHEIHRVEWGGGSVRVQGRRGTFIKSLLRQRRSVDNNSWLHFVCGASLPANAGGSSGCDTDMSRQ